VAARPAPRAPRQVSAFAGNKRWACRACALTHATRDAAEQCCTETGINSAYLAGGELLPPGHRTHAQVLTQLEQRMAELEKEAAKRKEAPPSKYPCATCKWLKESGSHHCTQPLIVGFGTSLPNMDYQLTNGVKLTGPYANWPTVNLCGREKALWEPVAPSPSLANALLTKRLGPSLVLILAGFLGLVVLLT
jgi:hypothetical protein